jgi:hypothetical protein
MKATAEQQLSFLSRDVLPVLKCCMCWLRLQSRVLGSGQRAAHPCADDAG